MTYLSLLLVHAEAVLKGTNVDGVYDCNSQDNNFTFKHISFRELVSRGATSMDMTALTFCEENNLPGTFSGLLVMTFKDYINLILWFNIITLPNLSVL